MNEVPGFSANARVLTNLDYKVQAGELFNAVGSAIAVADAATLDVLIRPGPIALHIIFIVDATGLTRVDLLEGVSTTVDGAVGTPVNRNRVKAAALGAPGATLFTGPTFTGGDSLVGGGIVMPGGEGGKSVGGEITTGAEWVFQPGLDYVMEMENVSGAPQDITARVLFYEEKMAVS